MKNYDFVCIPNSNGLNINNPLSSCDCTSDTDAAIWANGLLKMNPDADHVIFSHNKGRNLLRVNRDEYGFIYRDGHRYTGALHDIQNCKECTNNNKIVIKIISHRASHKLRNNFGLSKFYYHKDVFSVTAKGGFCIVDKEIGEAILNGGGSNWCDSKPVKGVTKAKDQQTGNYYPCLQGEIFLGDNR